MKRILLFAVALLFISPFVIAKKKAPHSPKAAEEIHWITSIDELQAKMAQNPKKVYMDVYTGWCGWCKKMDATTFQNPDLIKYINTNFYAVRLDAERQDVINFQGKEYHYEPQYKANTFAVEMLKGQMSYPTAVIMMENFQNPQVIPGYRTVSELELYLTYFGDNAYKHQDGATYQKNFKPRWDHGQAQDMTPPAGH
jgi:thioredoxin-related protein